MALQKTPVPINFTQGLETKVDPKQVQIGKFLSLQNSVFDQQGALSKRNGFANITSLPNALQTTITTLNDNLIATGSNLYALSSSTNTWLDKGIIQPIQVDTMPLVRASTSQSSPDTAISASGLTCLVYVDNSLAYYQISDSTTGQQVVARTALPATATNPRAFLLGRYFMITFIATVSGAPHLQFIAIPTNLPSSPSAATDVSANVASLTAGYDGYVINNNLYLSWAGTGSTIRTSYVTSGLVVAASVSIAASTATLMSMTADGANSVIWISYYDSGSTNGFVAAYDFTLTPVLVATQIITTTATNQITSVAAAGVLTVLLETANTYNYAPNAKTDFITKLSVTQAGTVSSNTVILRSVGLASKAFIDVSGTVYVLATYGETNQPTYFLIDTIGNIYMRLAYSNGGGYQSSQVLPTVSLIDDIYMTPYLIKDFLASVNKDTGLVSGTPVNGIYTQTGINLAKFAINVKGQYSNEIAGALHLTGGQLWEYDGVRPVEHGFHVWPENIVVTTATGAGNLTAQTYYYVFTYEWTDNQGNLHRSAPSIPVPIVTTTASSTNTIKVPTLRLTYKTSPNPVRIVGYRWSTAQQTYYQFTSITSPVVNDPSVDNVTIVDAAADSAILGQTLLYTTGGVIENIAAPASIASALFKNRLFLIDAEDRNLLWYSKQVIENTPVEMSDLLTLFVAPTTGAQGSTGPMTALSALDDKLIIFKSNAIYYLTGLGPDNTGANNDFSDPVFVSSSVGCTNPNSIVLMPNGIMFQSDKGIWLLGRDLSTTYIGAPVEAYNDILINSAETIPGTNEVRFLLAEGSITLMYDYYYGQWGTFTNINAISSTLYQRKHTYLNAQGLIFKETPGTYVDGASPVLLSFTTSWISLAGLQGYERFYEALFLGKYVTPFKLNVQFSYDYNSSPSQSTLILPNNYNVKFGGYSVYGAGFINSNVLEARVFPNIQKCETFQVTVTEVYDASFGVSPGEGLTLSGLSLTVGIKKGTRTSKSSQSFG